MLFMGERIVSLSLFYRCIMILQLIQNPNPIKLNATEQKAMDQIAENLWKKIFSKSWANSSAMVNNVLIFDETVMLTKFGEKPRPLRINVRGRKKRYNKYRHNGFGFTGGRLVTTTTWQGKLVKEELEIDLNGYAKKDSFSKMYRNDPYQFFIDYTGFLTTIRHELIHAKDPLAVAGYGTGSIQKRYGHLQYVNDPARLEIRSAMGEWDILLSEIQNIIKNKDKDEYHRKVYTPIEYLLCMLQDDFAKAEDKAQALFKFLTTKEFDGVPLFGTGKITPFVPKELGNRLKLYHDFWSVSDREAKKVTRAYERDLAKEWKKKHDEKMKIWKELQQMKKNEFTSSKMPKKLGENYKKAKDEANRIAKEKFRKKYPGVSLKKPQLKTKFTKKEFQNILDNRQRNYQEAIQTIYTLMKEKGFFDKSICGTETETEKKLSLAREKRAMTLLKKDKVVLYSLMERFENLR